MAGEAGARTVGYPTRPAVELAPGDLIHLGSLTFVLVAATEVVDAWLQVTLYDPERSGPQPIRPVAHLAYRLDQPVRIAHRGLQPPGSAVATGWAGDGAGTDHAADDEVDLDRVARLVRAAGIGCVIEVVDHASAAAVLLAGPPTAAPDWAHPWRAHAGPAVRSRNGRCTATTRTLAVGLHDGGATTPVGVADVGAVTEEAIAALVIAQTCTPTAPLTADTVSILGLRPLSGR